MCLFFSFYLAVNKQITDRKTNIFNFISKYFDLVLEFLFYWHSKFNEQFSSKAVLIEESKWYCLTQSWRIKRFIHLLSLSVQKWMLLRNISLNSLTTMCQSSTFSTIAGELSRNVSLIKYILYKVDLNQLYHFYQAMQWKILWNIPIGMKKLWNQLVIYIPIRNIGRRLGMQIGL